MLLQWITGANTHTHTYPKAAAWFVWFPGGMVMMTWWQMVGDRGGLVGSAMK